MSFEAWAIVDLMGHSQIAGKVSEEQVAGAMLLRVDVPEIEGIPAYTKYYSAASIYSLTPTDEATARLAVDNFRQRPVSPYILRVPTSPQLAEKVMSYGDFDDDDDESDEETQERRRVSFDTGF